MVLGEGLAPAIIDNGSPPVMIAAVARRRSALQSDCP
jgi:hypothetical protein